MVQVLAEKFELAGPAEKERVALVPQSEQLARTPELSLSTFLFKWVGLRQRFCLNVQIINSMSANKFT